MALDTNIFIYAFAQHPTHGSKSLMILKNIENGVISGLTTTITLTEIAVRPFSLSRGDLASDYVSMLTKMNNLNVLPLTPDLALEAARVRAKYPLRLPDAIQVAGALMEDATSFITNDASITKLGQINRMTLYTLDDISEKG